MIFDVAAFIVGIAAAGYWLAAARIRVEDPYPPSGPIFNPQQGDYEIPILKLLANSARFNKTAAALTAISVFLGTVGNLASFWPGN